MLPLYTSAQLSRAHTQILDTLRAVVGVGGGSSQTPNRGNSTQISSNQASQATAQSNQSTQEQVRSSIGSEHGGKYGGGSQDTTASALPSVGGNIQQAYRSQEALPFQRDYAEGSFGAFRL